jgi:predicted RNA-binding protein with TRAM domain
MGLVLSIAVLAILYLIVTSRGGNNEVIIGTNAFAAMPSTAAELNVGQVIDTIENPDADLREGFRYKVAITDMSREGTEGVTRIGGKVTLIRGTMKGDVAIVQVTSISRSIARAELVELLKKGKPAQATSPLKDIAKTVDATAKTLAGSEQDKLYRGTVEDVGRKGDGIVRVDGKVVFIPGAVKGDTITFRIVETREKYNRGELVSREQAGSGTGKDNAEEVTVGREYEVTVTEKDRKNPDKNGVTRINGLVVFIPGTQPGDKVRIRITDRAPRFARAIVLERLE